MHIKDASTLPSATFFPICLLIVQLNQDHMSSSGNSEDNNQDYHHPIPYEEAGIHHVMAANGICVDTLRENQHPPIDASVHSTTHN